MPRYSMSLRAGGSRNHVRPRVVLNPGLVIADGGYSLDTWTMPTSLTPKAPITPVLLCLLDPVRPIACYGARAAAAGLHVAVQSPSAAPQLERITEMEVEAAVAVVVEAEGQIPRAEKAIDAQKHAAGST
jgi:hypothetical protein